MTPILGPNARALTDHVTANFTVQGLTKGAGWWAQDPEGEAARYHHAASTMYEPARHILGDDPMDEISGARTKPGRKSSMHFPPVLRAEAKYAYLDRPPAERGAAIDFRPRVLRCDEAFWRLDAAMRDGRLPKGGLFWYAPNKTDPRVGGRFLHIDDRGVLARESKLTPPRVA
jgi:hypothetical protein